jgi:hypothetical protein
VSRWRLPYPTPCLSEAALKKPSTETRPGGFFVCYQPVVTYVPYVTSRFRIFFVSFSTLFVPLEVEIIFFYIQKR